MLTLLLLAQVASQPIILRDPFQPTAVRRLSSACGEQSLELRWTVPLGQHSRFDEISTNGAPLPPPGIEALNRWMAERSIEDVDVICEPDGPHLRTRIRVEFGRTGAQRLRLPRVESFEIIGDRLIFEQRAPRQDSPARGR